MLQFIDLKKQQDRIKVSLDKRIASVLQKGQYIMGPEIAELEESLVSFTGAPHCVTCANGTDALQMALMAIGIQPGDEVITTSFTFVSTVEVICLMGAKPVFVDIDPQTYNIDASLIEAAITPKTKAIIPVSLYGQTPDFDAINLIASKNSLVVMEDAAQSFGAEYKERKSCNLSSIATTSFFPSKPLGAYGDGGALFTQDEEIHRQLKMMRVHGQSKRYCHEILGVNSRLDTLQAAILLEKLAIFPDEVERRQQVAKEYDSLLSSGFVKPHIEAHNLSVFAQYTVRVSHRSEIQGMMKESGVPTAIHYPIPLHLQPAFESCAPAPGSLTHTEAAAREVLSLPFHPYLEKSDQARVVEALRQAQRKLERAA